MKDEDETTVVSIEEKDVIVSIAPSGSVTYTYKMVAKFYCWMNLKKFPFDTQRCSLAFSDCKHLKSKSRRCLIRRVIPRVLQQPESGTVVERQIGVQHRRQPPLHRVRPRRERVHPGHQRRSLRDQRAVILGRHLQRARHQVPLPQRHRFLHARLLRSLVPAGLHRVGHVLAASRRRPSASHPGRLHRRRLHNSPLGRHQGHPQSVLHQGQRHLVPGDLVLHLLLASRVRFRQRHLAEKVSTDAQYLRQPH
jgi:hypothetical protein